MKRPGTWSILAAGVLLTIATACTTRNNAPTSVAGNSTASSGEAGAGSAASDWPQMNDNYAQTRAARGSSISSKNVGKLGLAWTFSVPGVSAFGSMATAPIVVGGVVYFEDLKSNVYALDLNSGKLKWQKQFNADNVGPNGVAVDAGKVFVIQGEQTVTALDANSGEQVWTQNIAPPDTQGIDIQPTVYNGTVYVSTIPGPSITNFYTGGGMGIIYALDEATGAQKWSFNTVQNGDLWGNPQVNSGGGAWYPPAIDTQTGMTYWGVGNPAPWPGTDQYPNGSSRPGDNLYTNSELAIDGSSGKLSWYQQIKPHDLFDADFQDAPILASATINGQQKQVVIGSGKTGYVIAFDPASGQQLWKTAVGTHQNDDLTAVPQGQTVTVFPGDLGGVETPMAYADGVVFVPIVNMSSDYTPSKSSGLDLTKGTGELDAIDINTGKLLWKNDLKAPDFGGATVAGDLVFTSTYSGQMLAYDRKSGKQVWSEQAPAGINGEMTIVGDTILVPAGLGAKPQLLALKVGASGKIPLPPATSPTPPPSEGGPATPAANGGSSAAGTTLRISTDPNTGGGINYNTDTLTAPPNTKVTLTYSNNAAVIHNWHLYNGSDAKAPSIAQTPLMAGPNDNQSVQFTTPAQAGSYYFQCDVHPTQMFGHLVVK
jgi:outer membrane protein assembly factor BamB/plastocyanin